MTDPARAFVGERNDGLRFRPLTEADLPFVFALYASVRAAELAPVPWPEAAKKASTQQEEEQFLQIPAFLRRQAN